MEFNGIPSSVKSAFIYNSIKILHIVLISNITPSSAAAQKRKYN